MRDIYLVQLKPAFGGEVLHAADDFDRASMCMTKYEASSQARMHVVNVNLLEEGD